MPDTKPKIRVDDMSGFCRAGNHHCCKHPLETPSAIVTCTCQCHGDRIVQKKMAGGVVVKKKRV